VQASLLGNEDKGEAGLPIPRNRWPTELSSCKLIKSKEQINKLQGAKTNSSDKALSVPPGLAQSGNVPLFNRPLVRQLQLMHIQHCKHC